MGFLRSASLVGEGSNASPHPCLFRERGGIYEVGVDRGFRGGCI